MNCVTPAALNPTGLDIGTAAEQVEPTDGDGGATKGGCNGTRW